MDLWDIFIILYINIIESKKIYVHRTDFCRDLSCDDLSLIKVCGIREEFKGFRLKLFDNECLLLKYGCKVEEDKAYAIINLEYCLKAFSNESYELPLHTKYFERSYKDLFDEDEIEECTEMNCTLIIDAQNICGIRQDGVGYTIRLFSNKCELMRHNCNRNVTFAETDLFICEQTFRNKSDAVKLHKTESSDTEEKVPTENVIRNLVIVNTNMFDNNYDINATVETFFAATHVLDLPMREVAPELVNEITRRRLISVAGPVKVFQPWTTIPSNISEDYMHSPTLSSCYHKCPTKCPETYAPVCGVPGIVAREPSLMFKNHCFMDVAQCKMRWEDKSPTAISSSYIESSFMFCLGDQLNAMYRFLPLVRTLQHMGRLKKKGHFKLKLRNLRFFNSLLSRDPKLMG